MFVPYELVEVLLGQDLSAREAFLVSYPLLEDADLLEVCLPFLQYLQVASNAPSATEARPLALQDRLGLDTPIRPAVINERRETVLYRLLPDLRPRAGPQLPDALADNLGAGLTNIAAEMHADRQAREYRAGEARRPKTFRERYGDRITDHLLLLTNVLDDELLPPFYQSKRGIRVSPPSARSGPKCRVPGCASVQSHTLPSDRLENVRLCGNIHGRGGNRSPPPQHHPTGCHLLVRLSGHSPQSCPL
jgi:hypothetical protein